MLEFDQYSHKRFVISELERLIAEGSFASRLWRQIGAELHLRLVEWPFDESEVEYSKRFPVEALFLWVSQGDGLDPAWLEGGDDGYVADNGERIPTTVEATFSGTEQLAAYGLWLATSQIDCKGNIADEGHNSQGWTSQQVVSHQCECIMLAYQALSYAQRLMLGAPLSEVEIEKAKALHFSRVAKNAAEALHNRPGGTREKANRIREIWATGNFSNRDACAEQECGALGMSFSAARKALRNTPDPA